jgi:hypothetical protein
MPVRERLPGKDYSPWALPVARLRSRDQKDAETLDIARIRLELPILASARAEPWTGLTQRLSQCAIKDSSSDESSTNALIAVS